MFRVGVTAALLVLTAQVAGAQTLEAPAARPGNDIGTGESLPLSSTAGNIVPGDTQNLVAGRLPVPAIDENAPPATFIEGARQALAAGRTGEAQEAIERAESRALDRSVKPSQAHDPSRQPLVQQLRDARMALGTGDKPRTMEILAAALNNPEAKQQ
jgi:hypothetical protein